MWFDFMTRGLLANTEIPEDSLKQVLVGSFSSDETQLVQGRAEVSNKKIWGMVCVNPICHG
jgi:hypothetical protein